jgi:serine/threonine-protein kinase
MLPDVLPTVNALVQRVAHLATTLQRLDGDFDPAARAGIDARIAAAERTDSSTEELREIALLRRQRVSLEHLARQRTTLARQIEQGLLALGNLRLDLLKLRASGIEAGLADVSSATQEARALSREIGVALEAVSEVKAI